MRVIEGRKFQVTLPSCVVAAILVLFCYAAIGTGGAAAQSRESGRVVSATGSVIVQPKFGGIIQGYSIDPNGTEGLLTESVVESGGASLVAVEAFDQKTGAIIKVIAQQNHSLDALITQEIDAGGLGLVLHQHAGQNEFLILNPLNGNKFTGRWTPPIMVNYQLEGESVTQGTPEIAAYQSSFVTGLTYVFSSNVANNTFGPQISLQPIINGDEFFLPVIALNPQTNEAVLASSHDCPEPSCVESVALVDLTTGDIAEFSNNLGIGTVNGIAVDPATGIACTTTAIDQGVEFYDLAKQTGFEVTIPNSGSGIQAGLDVEFDRIHRVFLTAQYSSNGGSQNPDPQVYVYDEAGKVRETITGLQRIPVSPTLIAINPGTRTGFLPVVSEPSGLVMQLQSFSY